MPHFCVRNFDVRSHSYFASLQYLLHRLFIVNKARTFPYALSTKHTKPRIPPLSPKMTSQFYVVPVVMRYLLRHP